MFVGRLIILVVYLALVFQGCAALEYLDGSSREEIDKFQTTKEETWNEKLYLERQINTLKDQTDDEIQRLTGQNRSLNEEVGRLEQDNQRARDESQVLAQVVNSLGVKIKASSSTYDSTTHVGRLKIKVLTGDGNIDSARQMARKLGNLGYDIELVDYAPRSNFYKNTVYFVQGLQDEARRLTLNLGGNAVLKPLNWHSKFDVIVVASQNH